MNVIAHQMAVKIVRLFTDIAGNIKKASLLKLILVAFFVLAPLNMTSPALAAVSGHIKYAGFYHVDDDTYGLDYMAAVKGSANKITLTPDHFRGTDYASKKGKILANNFTAIDLYLGFDYWTGRFDNQLARKSYLNDQKNALKAADMLHLVKFIHIEEEFYGRLANGDFDRWPIFWNLTIENCRADYPNLFYDPNNPINDDRTKVNSYISYCRRNVLNDGLIKIIADVKEIFQGIPTIMVENDWMNWRIIPSNLDILSLDPYFTKKTTTPPWQLVDPDLCGPTQKAKFDSDVTARYNEANAIRGGRPIYMVAGAFIQNGADMVPSKCQIDWYFDLALSRPEIIGIDWFLYPTFSSVVGLQSYPDLANYIKQKNHEILGLSSSPTPTPTPPPTGGVPPVGNFDPVVLPDGIVGGWAYDPDSSSGEINVKIYFNGPKESGVLISTESTAGLRPDVNKAFGITGNHGFNIIIPELYRDGKPHRVYIYAVDPVSGSLTEIGSSPREFTITSTRKSGDINNDGKVDIFDYNILVENFTRTGANQADINNDGKVDIFDYNILVENFNK